MFAINVLFGAIMKDDREHRDENFDSVWAKRRHILWLHNIFWNNILRKCYCFRSSLPRTRFLILWVKFNEPEKSSKQSFTNLTVQR